MSNLVQMNIVSSTKFITFNTCLAKEGVLDELPTPSLTSPFAPPTGVLHNWLGVRPIFVSNLVHKPLAPL
jgi:hypothetical protein